MLKWIFLFLPLALFSQAVPDVVVFPQPIKSIGTISQIAPQNDTVWVVSNGKIYIHNGFDFYSLQPDSLLSNYDALSISPCDSGLFIGFYAHGIGFYHFKSKELRWPFSVANGYPELPDKRVGYIFNQSDTGLWVQSHHNGLAFVSFVKKQVKSFSTQNFAPSRSRGSNIVSQFVPHPTKKNLRIVSTLGGLFLFDLNTEKYTRHYDLSKENCLNPQQYNGNENSVRSVFAQGEFVWLATWGGGLLKLNVANGKFSKFVFQPAKRAPEYFQNFKTVFAVNDSVLSLADVDYGVLYFNTKTETFLPLLNSQGQPLLPYAYSFGKSKWGTFYGGKNQLFLLPKKDLFWKQMPFEKPLQTFKKSRGAIADVVFESDSAETTIAHEGKNYTVPFSKRFLIDWHAIEKSTLAVVSLREVYFVHGKQIEKLQLPWKERSGNGAEIISSYFDHANTVLWLGTKSSGAFGYNVKNKTWLPLQEAAFKRFWIKDITKINDRICFVGEQHFLFYTPESGQIEKLDFTELADLPLGFIPRKILVANEREVYLLSTKSGLVHIDFGAKTLAQKCVLPSEVSVESFLDFTLSDSGIFIGTSHGLLYWSATNGYRLFGESYRLGSVSRVELSHDTLWFMHQNALCFWPQPAEKSIERNYPNVLLTEFEVMGNVAQIQSEITLEYNQNWLEWNAVPSSFTLPQMGTVWVKLSGFSDQWREVSATKTFSISNLSPGDYTLVAKVTTRDNGFGAEHVLMQIKIVPAWFQTWWFYTAIALFMLALLYVLYRWRWWQLQKRQAVELQLQSLEMRMLRVQMNPHFIFNALNSVKYYIIKEDKNLASDYLARFSKLLRFILSISKAEKISLREELDGLSNYVEFERIRFNQKFSYSLSVAEEINAISTTLQPMIIQPFVENAIWHGLMPLHKEGDLQVRIHKKENYLHIEIEDNGVGREASLLQKNKAHKSFGLSITTERLQALAKKTGKLAQFEIIDKIGSNGPEGTLVKITVPYESINS